LFTLVMQMMDLAQEVLARSATMPQGPEAETLRRFILRITDPDGQRNERVVVE
jgi:hypothetical protein